MKIIVASNNQHKIIEIREIMEELGYEVSSLRDEAINLEPEENGETFLENAFIKAKTIYDYVMEREGLSANSGAEKKEQKIFVLADDSGLSVDYLKGAPGIYSARYAGEQGDDAANNKKLLKELSGIAQEDRGATFVCAIVLIGEDLDIRVQGESAGFIIEEAKGNQGFGYDPLFFSTDLQKTFAQASAVEKNQVSHRGRALEKLRQELTNR